MQSSGGIRRTVDVVPGITHRIAFVVQNIVSGVGVVLFAGALAASELDDRSAFARNPALLIAVLAVDVAIGIGSFVWSVRIQNRENAAGYETFSRSTSSPKDLVDARSGVVIRPAGTSMSPSEVRSARRAARL